MRRSSTQLNTKFKHFKEERKMDHIKQFMTPVSGLQPQVPSWAKAERMETVLPQSRLWKYSTGVVKAKLKKNNA